MKLITLKIVPGLLMADSKEIFLANSIELSLRRMRLPKMTPVVWRIACSIATICGSLSSLMAMASSEISCRQMKKTPKNIATAIIISNFWSVKNDMRKTMELVAI